MIKTTGNPNCNDHPMTVNKVKTRDLVIITKLCVHALDRPPGLWINQMYDTLFTWRVKQSGACEPKRCYHFEAWQWCIRRGFTLRKYLPRLPGSFGWNSHAATLSSRYFVLFERTIL